MFDQQENFLIDPESTLNYLQFKTKPSSLAQFVWKWDKKCKKGPSIFLRKLTFFLIFCIFSAINLKQIIFVLDDGNQPVQNRRKFATAGKKTHIDNSFQFFKIKVLRVAIVFEDPVTILPDHRYLSDL